MRYRKWYFCLFNAITDALAQIENNNYGNAAEILKNAQSATEEKFIDQSTDFLLK